MKPPPGLRDSLHLKPRNLQIHHPWSSRPTSNGPSPQGQRPVLSCISTTNLPEQTTPMTSTDRSPPPPVLPCISNHQSSRIDHDWLRLHTRDIHEPKPHQVHALGFLVQTTSLPKADPGWLGEEQTTIGRPHHTLGLGELGLTYHARPGIARGPRTGDLLNKTWSCRKVKDR